MFTGQASLSLANMASSLHLYRQVTAQVVAREEKSSRGPHFFSAAAAATGSQLKVDSILVAGSAKPLGQANVARCGRVHNGKGDESEGLDVARVLYPAMTSSSDGTRASECPENDRSVRQTYCSGKHSKHSINCVRRMLP